ncbi:MAG TPA: hypothetical protein VG737_17120 [Cyclobacteriaceae bacterium]|nr:hypothetical protein [Cyclobacteriaceae bacterium]
MEAKKVSKKALRTLLKDSLQQTIGHLELPKPNKKVKKIINRTTKKMAVEFSHLLKKEFKRSNPKQSKKAASTAEAA